MERCSDANTFYSIEYSSGTFADRERVTAEAGGITYTFIIIGELSSNPGGGLLTLTATGFSECPATTTTTTSTTTTTTTTAAPTTTTTTLSFTEYRVYGYDAGGDRSVACSATNIPPSSPQTVYAATSNPFSVTQFYNTADTSSPFTNIPNNGDAVSFSTAADTSTKYAGFGTTTGAISSVIAC